MKNLSTLLAFLFFCTRLFSQVIYTVPVFPIANGPVTIFFDATKGNGALANYSGDVFIHTGVITNLSVSPSDWKHVTTTWGSTDPAYKMTSLGNNLYSFYIPNIMSYYGVSGTETIEQLAMVFRNGDGSIVGRDADGSDIFYDVWDGITLETSFLSPSESPHFAALSENTEVIFVTSLSSTISLYEDNNLLTQVIAADSLNYTITALSYGVNIIKAVANDGISQVADSFFLVVNPPVTVGDLPLGVDDGINYIDDSTATLVLVAPKKDFVYAIGDFSDWVLNDSMYMNMTSDSSRWWITLHHLIPQKEYTYQYLVDGNLYIADPYSDKILDPYNDPYIPASTYPDLIAYPTGKASGNVSILQTAQTAFNWQTTGYVRPDPDNLVIYELLLRDFISARNFQTLKDTLNYLKTLGITAIELMPFNEFEGNDSWGYNPDFYFAPDKYYGTKDALKSFIDACHSNGIAVIQDIVFNHSCGQSPMVQLYYDPISGGPSAENPWFNPDQDLSVAGYQGPHPFGVCYDFNHESPYTQKFVDDVLKYWNQEYRIDGWRFDLSKGFTQFYSGDNVGLWGQYDQSRIDNLDRLATQIRTVDPNVILILEHFAENKEEDTLSNHNFYLWANCNYNYSQNAMGYSSGADIGWVSYVTHGFTMPHAVGYMESHDEERVAYRVENFGNHNSTYDVRPLDSTLNRLKLAACFFFPVPGPKMIWQFGELGYDFSIGYGGSNVADKPIRWDYYAYGPRKWLYNFYKSLIALKENYSVFLTTNFSVSIVSLVKSIHLNDASMNVTILGNFDIVGSTIYPSFQHTGWWFDYFTGDSLNVTNVTAGIFFQPGEYRLYTDVKLPQPDLGNVGINDPINTQSLSLLQNVPNPFSEITTIDFYIPKQGLARLEVYDLYGRLVKVVTDKYFPQGYYTVDLPASDFAEGIYFCKLTQNDEARTIKMEVGR